MALIEPDDNTSVLMIDTSAYLSVVWRDDNAASVLIPTPDVEARWFSDPTIRPFFWEDITTNALRVFDLTERTT